MLQCTIRKPPRISLHSCRQALGKLGNEQGKSLHIQQAGSLVRPQTIPFLQGLLSLKMAENGAADASSLEPPPHVCGLILWAELPAVISHERDFMTGISEHWGSCQPLTSQLKFQSCKTQKTNFPGPPKRTRQDNTPTSPFQTPIQHWCCLQKAVFHPWQTQHHS